MTQGDRNQAGTDPKSLKRNKELVDKVLEDTLVPALKPFIQQKMKARYGNNWLQDAPLNLPHYHFEGNDLKWKDPQVVLKLIWEQWFEVFREPQKFDYAERNLVSELIGVRNAVKHNELKKFDNDYTYRALDSMERLLSAIPAKSAAQEVAQHKEEFRRLWQGDSGSEDKSKPTISKQPGLAELLGVPHQFQALIEEKTQGFVGRGFVFEAIEEFLKKQPNGYFIIEGEPGIGKSAILAKYVQQTGCIAHFNVRSQGITSVERFLKNVCTQLISRYNLPYSSLPTDATRDGQFFAQLLGEVSAKLKKGERLVIAIDALDEVDRTDHTGANLLYLPTRLDKGVYFVMTQRPGTLPLTVNTPPHRFDLMQHQQQNLQDIQTYIRDQVNKSSQLQAWIDEKGLTVEEFITQLANKMLGRLMSLEVPSIQAMLEQIKPRKNGSWLRPLIPNLRTPGGAVERTLIGHSGWVEAVALTPDGKRVISVSDDKTLKVWNWETGQELFTFTGHTEAVNAVAVTPDGKWVISGSDDKTLKLWNLETGN